MKKQLKNLVTGNNIKEMKLNPAIIRCLFLTNYANEEHILICRHRNYYYVKHKDGVRRYRKEEIKEHYGIELTEELISKLSLK